MRFAFCVLILALPFTPLLYPTASSAGPKEPVTLSYMFWGGEEERSIRTALSEEFNRLHEGIRIKPIHAPDDYDRKLKTMMGAGMAPDIFHLSDSEVAKWAAKGVLMDLMPFYAVDPEASLDDFVPQEVEKRMYNGKFYGISDATETMNVFYGTELFRRWNVPFPPEDHVWSWDEFVETARALTKDTDADGRTDQWGCYVSQWDGVYDPLLWSVGGRHYSEDFTELYPDGEKALRVIQLINDLVHVHRVMPPYGQLTAMGQTASHLLETGKLGMLITGQWYTINLAQANFPFDVAPLPKIEDESNILISSNFSIYAHTKHPEAAWEAYKFLSGEKGQILLSRSGIVMPTYKRLLFSEEGRRLWQVEGVHPPHHTFGAVLPILYAGYTPPFAGGDQLYFDVTRRYMEEIILAGSRDEIPDIVQRMSDAADRFLRDYQTQEAEEQRRGPVDHAVAAIGRFLERKRLVAALFAVPVAALLFVAVRRIASMATSSDKRRTAIGYLFVFPTVLGLVLWSFGPIMFSVFISLTKWDIVTHPRFVGLRNYGEMLADPLVLKSLWVTAYYTIVSVPLGILAALLVALLLNTKVRGMPVFRTIFYLPSIVPVVATAVLWVWIFNPEYGLLNSVIALVNRAANALLGWAGGAPAQLPEHLEWLQDEHLVMPALWLMGLWGAGGGMLIYLAGLQGIPKHLYESAELDGAGWWSKFVHVTLPMISPVIFFNLIMGTIGSFQVFIAGYLMTGGGPKDATLFYVLNLYRNAFHYLKMGYASAQAWVLFVIILVLTLLMFRTAGKKVYYEGG